MTPLIVCVLTPFSRYDFYIHDDNVKVVNNNEKDKIIVKYVG